MSPGPDLVRRARESGTSSRGPGAASPLWALLFVGPMGLGIGVFYLWPIARTLAMSFTDAGPFGDARWSGAQNYLTLLRDPELVGAIGNTALYTAITLLGVPLAMVLAALLNTAGLRGKSLYRLAYFLPVVTMPAAVGLVWRSLYNGDYGVINQFLAIFGIDGPSWLTDPRTAIIAISVVGVWSGLGASIIIFIAGMQSIPSEVLDAAALDGAGPVRSFVSITVPLLTPSVFFVTVITVIGAFQVFDLIYLMMGPGNPALPHTRTIVYLFFEAGFVRNERGYAAAVAIVLLAFILLLTLVQFRLQKRWVHYE